MKGTLGFWYGKGSRPVLQIIPNYTRLYHILRDEYPFPTILALRFQRFDRLTPACEVQRRSRRFFLGSDRDFTCKDEKVSPIWNIWWFGNCFRCWFFLQFPVRYRHIQHITTYTSNNWAPKGITGFQRTKINRDHSEQWRPPGKRLQPR